MDYDPLAKRLGRLKGDDFVRFVCPKMKIEKVSFCDREFELTHRRVDTLYKVETKEYGEFFLNLEFQGNPEENFLERLFLYSSRVLYEYKLPVKTVVFFLKSTKGVRELPCPFEQKLGEEELTRLNYTKIILAEADWKAILKTKFEGLLPLIPLMKIEKAELKEALEKTVKTIEKIKDGELRKDLAGIFYMISEDKYSKKLITGLIGDKLMEELKESRVYQELIAEGKGLGRRQAGKELTLKHLKRRFKKVVPKRITTKLDLITSFDDFDELLEEVYKAKDLESFEKELDKLVKKATKAKK